MIKMWNTNKSGKIENVTPAALSGKRYIVCTVTNSACPSAERTYFYEMPNVVPSYLFFLTQNEYCTGDSIELHVTDNYPQVLSTYTGNWSWSQSNPITGVTYGNEPNPNFGSPDTDAYYYGTATTLGSFTVSVTGNSSYNACTTATETVSDSLTIAGATSTFTFSPSPGPDYTIMNGCSIDITATASVKSGEYVYYEWRPQTGLDLAEIYSATVTASPTVTTTYTVYAKKNGVAGNSIGCCSEQEVVVNVVNDELEIFEQSPVVFNYWYYHYNLKEHFLSNSSSCPTGASCPTKKWFITNNYPDLSTASGTPYASNVDQITYNNYGAAKYVSCFIDIDFPGSSPIQDCNNLMSVYYIAGPLRRMEENPGESSNSNSLKLLAYPNPNDGSFYLESIRRKNGEGILTLYDIYGKEYFRKAVQFPDNNLLTIHLPDSLSDGLYLLSFKNSTGNYFVKLIISHL